MSIQLATQAAYAAGFRGEDLVNMVAIAGRESSYKPTAHRTNRNPADMSGDMGLWQINSANWGVVSQKLGLSSKDQLFDPFINARAAKILFDDGGYFPWGMGPGSTGWQAGGDPFHKTDRNRAAQVVQQMANDGTISQGSYGGGGVSDTAGETTNFGPVEFPPDAKLYHVVNFGHLAVFEVAPGVNITYHVDDFSMINGKNFRRVSDTDFNQLHPPDSIVPAGSARELATVAVGFDSYKGLWDSIVGSTMGYNNPALNDPGVLKVLGQFAARPDMSDAELQNLLRDTDWFKERTEAELEWNDLSPAEREKRIDDATARAQGTWFQFGGEQLDPDDPRIADYVVELASGKLSYGAFTQIVKDIALEMPESPWARENRDEQESQRQRPIDIENTAQRIREASERWGVAWSPETVTKWAKDMVEKNKSDEDLETALRDQAQVLYPWKDPELDTATAAAPWLETYRRVYEDSATIFTPEVAKSLQQGQAVFDFEADLKKGDRWLSTKNGQNEITSAVTEMGRRMGFA